MFDLIPFLRVGSKLYLGRKLIKNLIFSYIQM